MAIIECPECSGKVSTHATSCPHCGCPGTAFSQPAEAKQTDGKAILISSAISSIQTVKIDLDSTKMDTNAGEVLVAGAIEITGDSSDEVQLILELNGNSIGKLPANVPSTVKFNVRISGDFFAPYENKIIARVENSPKSAACSFPLISEFEVLDWDHSADEPDYLAMGSLYRHYIDEYLYLEIKLNPEDFSDMQNEDVIFKFSGGRSQSINFRSNGIGNVEVKNRCWVNSDDTWCFSLTNFQGEVDAFIKPTEFPDSFKIRLRGD